MALANGFKAKAAALGLGLASTIAPAVVAEEQPPEPIIVADAGTTPASPFMVASAVRTEPVVAPGALVRAIDWAAETDGVAVSVAIGTDSRFSPADIETILTNDFAKAGESNVRFFFEQNDISSTTVSYHYGVTGSASSGPLYLRESQDAVAEAVEQNHFYESHPELGV